MGAFKPLLPFGASTVVETCVETLRAAGVAEVVVVVGHRAGEVQERLAGAPSVRFALNEEAASEMGASIARGVEQLSEEACAVVVALADQPGVPPSVVRELVDAWRRTRARIVQPEWEGRGGHPVLIDLSLREGLMRLEESRGLRALFEERRGEVLRVPSRTPFVRRDMDTWEEYQRLHEEVFGRRPRAEAG